MADNNAWTSVARSPINKDAILKLVYLSAVIIEETLIVVDLDIVKKSKSDV